MQCWEMHLNSEENGNSTTMTSTVFDAENRAPRTEEGESDSEGSREREADQEQQQGERATRREGRKPRRWSRSSSEPTDKERTAGKTKQGYDAEEAIPFLNIFGSAEGLARVGSFLTPSERSRLKEMAALIAKAIDLGIFWTHDLCSDRKLERNGVRGASCVPRCAC